MIDPKHYCVFMNNYPFIDNDGYVAMCCKNQKNKLTNYHISEHKLSDIWNSPEMQANRQLLLDEKVPYGCGPKCHHLEAKGIRSFREKTLGMLNKGKPFTDHKIHALDLRLGNICNLACIMCFAGNSNLIYKQLPKMAEHFDWKESKLNSELEKYKAANYKWTEDPVAWDNIISSVDSTLRHVYLAGGEPFYLRNFPDTVRKLSSFAPNAKFVINTNGTRLLREKDLKALSDIDIGIRFSVDGWGKADEFTRQETDFEEKLQVMKQYHEHFNVQVWDMTLNAFSVRQAPEMISYLKEHYPEVKIQVRPVINKNEILMKNIPIRFREPTAQWLEQHRDSIDSGLDHVLDELRVEYEHHDVVKKNMRNYIEYWEKTGSVKIEEFDPELAEWLWSDGE